MKKLILAVAVSTFLIACGGSEHGPLMLGGNGNSNGNGEVPEGPVTKPDPPEAEGVYAPIDYKHIQAAKDNKIRKIKIGDTELTINYKYSNSLGGQGLEHHTNVGKDEKRSEIFTIVGDHSVMGMFRTEEEAQTNQGPWEAFGARAIDRVDFLPQSGKFQYKGEAIGVANANVAQSAVTRGKVNMNVDFLDGDLNGTITGKGIEGAPNAFGENGIYINGRIIKDSLWQGTASDGVSGNPGNASGYFYGRNAPEMNGSYVTGDGHGGVFIGKKQ